MLYPRRTIARLALMGWMGTLMIPWPCMASEAGGFKEVTVVVASGRQFRGWIDPRSSPQALVLRTVGPGLTLWRPIAWERIVAAETEGKSLPVNTLRQWASSPHTARIAHDLQVGKTAPPSLTNFSGQVAPHPAAPPPDTTHGPERVVQITFDAYLANWDADVEADGLVVELAPRADDGAFVPVAGTVEVELFGLQRRVFSDAPLSGGDTVELIERWTRRVEPEEAGPSGILLKLPFGAIHPELQADWLAWWYGLVHVRLTVPGQGVFDASRDGVRLRPWGPVRDRRERAGAGRMLPTEGVGRTD